MGMQRSGPRVEVEQVEASSVYEYLVAVADEARERGAGGVVVVYMVDTPVGGDRSDPNGRRANVEVTCRMWGDSAMPVARALRDYAAELEAEDLRGLDG